MILLMHPKYFDLLVQQPEAMRRFAEENHVPDGTPIQFVDDLPEYDDEGKPVFAFLVSPLGLAYWRGAPIHWSPDDHSTEL